MIMERKLRLGLWVWLLCNVLATDAQEMELDCRFRFDEAIIYLKGNEFVARDSLRAVDYLKPCVEAGDSNSQLLMGRLYLNGNNPDNYKKGFRLVKEAAKQGNEKAACDMGILYKYGKGCKLNFDKSRRWFRKALKLGSDKAAYSLGYLYYKGLGTIAQDYSEAVKWFQKSEYPMAVHWLAQCYYFGYGVPKDKSLALQMLQDNKAKNSKILLNYLQTDEAQHQDVQANMKMADTLHTTLQPATYDEENSFQKIPFEVRKLNGKWTGYLVQFDWSGTQIVQTIPFGLQLEHKAEEATVLYRWIADGVKSKGVAMYESDALYFEDLRLSLPRVFIDNENQRHLDYQIVSGTFELKKRNGVLYASAALESFVPDWREPGAPMSLLLVKDKKDAEGKVVLSEEALLALAAQKQNFIQLYPNPFKEQLLIAYTLEKQDDVQVQITSLDGLFSKQIARIPSQKAGDHFHHFDGTALQKGTYVVRISKGGAQYTKLIVKN